MDRIQLFEQLRCIVVRYETDPDDSFEQNKNDAQFQVHKDDVKDFIRSLIKYGINPHNKQKTINIKMIAINKPICGKYWWTSPDLIDTNKSIDTLHQWTLDKHIYLSAEINKNLCMTIMWENEANAYACDPENLESSVQEKADSMQFDEYIDDEYQEFM